MTVSNDDRSALEQAERELAEADQELLKAKSDLAAAGKEVSLAEQDLKQAENALHRVEENHPFKVEVSYNGVSAAFEVRPDELVSKLLQQALNKLGPIPNPHTMALYDAAGNELSDSSTIKAAGVKPGDHLLLRPSKVKGG